MSSSKTSSSNSNTASSSSAYTAFNAVDEMVAKPVLGSDGAQRWQEFRSTSKSSSTVVSSSKSTNPNVPQIPLKSLDRALGFQSWNDERTNETTIRKITGTVNTVGYTNFKQKQEQPVSSSKKSKKAKHSNEHLAEVESF